MAANFKLISWILRMLKRRGYSASNQLREKLKYLLGDSDLVLEDKSGKFVVVKLGGRDPMEMLRVLRELADNDKLEHLLIIWDRASIEALGERGTWLMEAYEHYKRLRTRESLYFFRDIFHSVNTHAPSLALRKLQLAIGAGHGRPRLRSEIKRIIQEILSQRGLPISSGELFKLVNQKLLNQGVFGRELQRDRCYGLGFSGLGKTLTFIPIKPCSYTWFYKQIQELIRNGVIVASFWKGPRDRGRTRLISLK